MKNKLGFWAKISMFLAVVGPGLITANIDNDAGGIATYSIAGSKTGLRLLWVMFPITIALVFIQEMSARMGIVSGKGLADLIREKFGLKITFYSLILLVIADLGNTMAEFAGIAASGEILGVSKYISVPLSGLAVFFIVLKGNYKTVEKIFLVGCCVYLSYIVSGIIINPSWSEVIKATFIPDFTDIRTDDAPILIGLIGTTITPWMQFYLQSATVEKGLKIKDLNFSRLDIFLGCMFMFLVSWFIVVCCAVTIFQAGVEINSAADAAIALEPLAGKYSSLLFSFGLFNASFFAAALLPLATSYYVCEGMGWESGVNKSFKEAPNFFIIFALLIFVSVAFVLIPDINLFNILIWSQVLNGLLIPLVIIFIVNLCNDPDVVGEYTNSTWFNFTCYLIIGLMIAVNSMIIYYEF